MRPQNVLRFFVVNGLAVGLGATVAGSCIKVNYPTVAFRCDPRQGDNCPDTHFCCSDDPSTADGDLPAYTGKNINGSVPLYADAANRAGTSGMCVRTEDIPMGSGLLDLAALNCPIPCNPKWDAADVAAVCGPAPRVCCQTVELGDRDCVQEDGVWRAVSGADIGDPGVVPTTVWNNVAHETHQDPNGTVCLALAGGNPESEVFIECISHLTVADQRGFCMSLQPGQACPASSAAIPPYVSICEAKNGTPPPMGG